MYKIPFRSDNTSLDTILSKKKTTTYGKKCKEWPKWPIFTVFDLHYPPGNGPLMVIESRNTYKMPFKSYNPSFGMILSERNQSLWTKNTKNGQNYQFSLFLPTLPPEN